MQTSDPLTIGWARTDLTPDAPVQLSGQFHMRVSEGVLDPVSTSPSPLSASRKPC